MQLGKVYAYGDGDETAAISLQDHVGGYLSSCSTHDAALAIKGDNVSRNTELPGWRWTEGFGAESLPNWCGSATADGWNTVNRCRCRTFTK